MHQHVRFGDYLQEVGVRHATVSYNDVVAASPSDTRIRPGPAEALTILRPYVTPRVLEQLLAVAPLAAYLTAFQLLFLREPVGGSATIVGGLLAVVVGLTLFLEGLKLGLMPLGQEVGTMLPTHRSLPVVLAVVFLLGIGVTLAEPAIGALKTAGATVSAEESALLSSMLGRHSATLVLVVALGVGLSAVLGTLRLVHGWSLKPVIFGSLVPCLVLTLYAAGHPELRDVVGLAWDSGAVTTGPVTVPLVLALGVGVAHAVGRGGGSLAGFGIVTLASIFPVLGVLLLAILLPRSGVPMAVPTDGGWWTSSPAVDLIGAVRAIVPLVVFLVLVLRLLVQRRISHPWTMAWGVALALSGMACFNLGLSYGLSELGRQSGSALPAAFIAVPGRSDTPLYMWALGITLVLAFAWILGLGATMAEPALNALGRTVEDLTHGAFPRRLLSGSVAVGVACGIALGVAKLVFEWDLWTILVPGYALLLVLTAISSEEFVNVAWDSAGVTTGPVTVPLVLSIGIGLGGATGASDGFGILALASLCPIASVLVCGLYIQWKIERRHLG